MVADVLAPNRRHAISNHDSDSKLTTGYYRDIITHQTYRVTAIKQAIFEKDRQSIGFIVFYGLLTIITPYDTQCTPGLILGLRPANERRRYFVTTSLIGWVQA